MYVNKFIPGQEYKRSEIHDKYGGNRQRGISNSKDHPMIFIFTGKSGENYGYEDGWQDNTTFYYTGEGQVGDQEFKEGNKALRDHLANGKELFLFEKSDRSGYYELINQFNCTGYHLKNGKDKNGSTREIIIFELEVVGEYNQTLIKETNEDILNKTLEELRQLAINTVNNTHTPNLQQQKSNVYKRANAIKVYALKRANGICESCDEEAPFIGVNNQPFLEVHHLNRLSDGGIDHPVNVAAICPNCHRRSHHGKDQTSFNNRIKEKIHIKENRS
ncbi:HNH endonuclease signature motif containing protein [Litchfieldia salsa]|uniref:5-methylcytosine-specific restriction enzyme A n=1 Tax=Litchfieldia salsa TaxID=930152 RepID=A0A1H0PM66_9BACI|nr:HNH endonuclease signature motif containing protein [Litchfieldia salsa]SDP06202.1 5-methylcytosine-specific restriction enzyme A [Litchfieldia salsa]